jgi:hypothetical protein
MEASAIACEAKALQQFLPERGAKHRQASSRCPLIDLGSAAKMRFELRRPLATGPMQKWIHGLS